VNLRKDHYHKKQLDRFSPLIRRYSYSLEKRVPQSLAIMTSRHVDKEIGIQTTIHYFSNGCLGFSNDEERSEM